MGQDECADFGTFQGTAVDCGLCADVISVFFNTIQCAHVQQEFLYGLTGLYVYCVTKKHCRALWEPLASANITQLYSPKVQNNSLGGYTHASATYILVDADATTRRPRRQRLHAHKSRSCSKARKRDPRWDGVFSSRPMLTIWLSSLLYHELSRSEGVAEAFRCESSATAVGQLKLVPTESAGVRFITRWMASGAMISRSPGRRTPS